jgi:hypothetical protein
MIHTSYTNQESEANVKNQSTFLNIIFLISAVGGFAAISGRESLSTQAAFIIPSGIVLIYGLIVLATVGKIEDFDLAEHQTESIYFIGFLFTLISLAVLFYRFSKGFFSMESTEQIGETFHFIGISVTTSITGILIRNMIRSGVLSKYSNQENSLDKSYEILQELAGEFSTGYKNIFENLHNFMEERQEHEASLNMKEKEYMSALDGFIEATHKFSDDLKAADAALVNQVEYYTRSASAQSKSIEELHSTATSLSEVTSSIQKSIESIPMEDVSENIRTLGRETGDLNVVIDSLLEIMDHKLEKI